jgi:tRNA-2-methylthio-N6-dimethylallyladenosine synthase
MLERMRRPYTREGYLELIENMKSIIPGVSLSTDIITGFCDETEEEHQQTLSLMAEVEYDLAYMFAYSERERTLAHRKYEDNVPEKVKKQRLSEIITQQREIQERRNKDEVGKRHLVLVEGTSKKSEEQMSGRTDTNKMVVFDRKDFEPGDYVEIEVMETTSATLIARPIRKTTLSEYYGAEVVA